MPRLISDAYQKLNHELHAAEPTFGGQKRVVALLPVIVDLARVNKLKSVLDYGCGKGDLKPLLVKHAPQLDVREYDPAVPGKIQMPQPADIVCCLDVMEHIEPEFLEDVLQHIRGLTIHCCVMRVSLRPAQKILADGRNAHLILEKPEWWTGKIAPHFNILKSGVNYKKNPPDALECIDYILTPRTQPAAAP